MSVVPFPLPAGYVLVYGTGINQSLSGIIPTSDNFRFATIYQIWDGGSPYVQEGENVMFDVRLATDSFYFNGAPYTMIPARIVTKDIAPP